MNRKGFSAPIVIIFVAVFLALPVAYFLFAKNSLNNVSVKGASDQIEVSKDGLGIYINSRGTWDLFEYLCKDKAECTTNLMSGTRWGTVSGGGVNNFRVKIPSDSDWGANTYLKVFVREGWGSMQRSFDLQLTGTLDGVEVENFTHEGTEYKVLVIEIEKLKGKSIDIATYTDLQ